MFGFKRRRRERLRSQPFPAEWLEVIEKNVPHYRCLSLEEQKELQGHIQVFLSEKNFEGCGGLEMNDEIRVTIAAQACILLLHRETEYYPTLQSILVYPRYYRVSDARLLADGTVIEGTDSRLGESWLHGVVVLSWDDVKGGAADIHDGHNVVFHEFAHQLDGESGSVEGAPDLVMRSRYIAWARVLGQGYQRLLDDLKHHRPTLLDSYAATDHAEFFAVLTECFFEKPSALKKRHPELYERLRDFYQQDPAIREKVDGGTTRRT